MMQRTLSFQQMMTLTQPHQELQALVGRALVDPKFRKDLLNGHRQDCLAEFPLTPDELIVASSVVAGDLTSFAAQVDQWICDKMSRASQLAEPVRKDGLAVAA